MIRLPDRQLPDAAQAKLDTYQKEIDGIDDYPTRVERATMSWKSRNRKGDPTFDAVKETLTEMCSGARRCVYCEDSAADEIEHFRPKVLYPGAVFAWPNYLYACGPCNGPKNNQFAVFAHGSGEFTEVARGRGAPVVLPIAGDIVLIDPRAEDPCEYMALDLQDTFWFVPRARRETSAYRRAEYTIRVLRLNENEFLPKARQQAYKDYKAHLSQYRLKQEQGAPRRHLKQLEREVQCRQHPTVWSEMKRQHGRIPELSTLFKAVPQALSW
ncbi:hypothetical protein [Sorangium sp. So ce124]|uniref:hypothetical protein n=1 Tax=Sorangium sp. So ce124 TaxID=3133280 RepID=UPI003F624EB3